jgi:hypothetical protein
MQSAPPFAAAAARIPLSPGGASDVRSILVDEVTDVARVDAGLRTGVGNGAAESNVIANRIDAGRILEEVVHVCLANPESSVDVSAVVSLSAFGHAAALLSEVIYLECGKQQADGG